MKSVEFSQMVAVAINHTTWNIPRVIDDGQWRNIRSPDLVVNPNCINGYDRFEDAIFRLKEIMTRRGWQIEIGASTEHCHEHLSYLHYRLTCRK
ncbi:MAG: hypothetical protein ABIL58_15295 [Pseudomonadota bacterium]